MENDQFYKTLQRVARYLNIDVDLLVTAIPILKHSQEKGIDINAEELNDSLINQYLFKKIDQKAAHYALRDYNYYFKDLTDKDIEIFGNDAFRKFLEAYRKAGGPSPKKYFVESFFDSYKEIKDLGETHGGKGIALILFSALFIEFKDELDLMREYVSPQ